MNQLLSFSTGNLLSSVKGWARDQREREAWKDQDRRTYRHRADLLEAIAARVESFEATIAELLPVVRAAQEDMRGCPRCESKHPDLCHEHGDTFGALASLSPEVREMLKESK